MNELPKAYVAKDYEDAIYKVWNGAGVFQPNLKSKKKPFTITMPPPNATGTLHLGHAVMLALEDIMIRFQRMQGRPALWVPGTDHAGIATQNKVEKDLLKDEKKTRHDLGREKFLERVKTFVEQSQNTIRSQIKKMGSSCDWTREAYTMDEALTKTVYFVFEKMFKDGLIYRGDRIVNWCTRCQSTLADDEVSYKEVKGKFYYFQYGPFVIGTARPETKYGDHVVVVHPDDERYKKYHGKKLEVPWIGDEPIIATVIADSASDMALGSGVMTATPAHSFVDFDLAKKHGFDMAQMINEQGRLTAANGKFEGLPVEDAREKFVEILHQKKLVVNIDENYVHNLSLCYRCGTVIQPLISKQWFIDVNHPVSSWDYKMLQLEHGRAYSIKEVALHVVREELIEIIPDRFNATYFQWLENLRDWCISRQIWWGHRIPVWYKNENIHVSNRSPGHGWRQDNDTFDTWFSSGLFTFSTLGWLSQNRDFKTFHPTQVLETGYDILFFWVARMILLTTYVTGQIPFEKVYLHGLIRTRDGKKMSKSNPETCIDPLEMIHAYGADALRLSLFVGSSPGNDTRLYKEKIAGYRNFVNKLWNVGRYILSSVGATKTIKPLKPKTLSDRWILSKLQSVIAETSKLIESFQFSQAAEQLYAFTWNDVADWYLEISKIQKQTPKLINTTDQVLMTILETVLKLWHPFTPFVTEQLWSYVNKRDLLISSPWPKAKKVFVDTEAEKNFEKLREVIVGVRNLRTEHGIEPSRRINALIVSESFHAVFSENEEIVKHLGRLENLVIHQHFEKREEMATKIFDGATLYLPIKGIKTQKREKERLAKELNGLEAYAKILQKKLDNEGFVKNAPNDIVEAERLKLQEIMDKMEKIQHQLQQLVLSSDS